MKKRVIMSQQMIMSIKAVIPYANIDISSQETTLEILFLSIRKER